VGDVSEDFFSEAEKAVLFLIGVQRALSSSRVSKKYIARVLSSYGLDHEQALRSLERKGYLVSVGYKGGWVAFTRKGERVRL